MFRFKTSDAHLVAQVLRGQKDQYAELVERYLPAVQAVARANAGTHADADDIAQETFIDAFRKLDTLREANKFAHWLMRIARNKACDWAAAEIRERVKREAGAVQGGQDAPTAEQRELYALLHQELESMPAEQREILALFHFAGHGTREIAGMLGISHVAVRKRLQRGREALGERMLHRMEGLERDPAAVRQRARKIYGAAVGIPAAWEAQGAATSGVAGFAVSAGWSGVAAKGAVFAIACAALAGAYWGISRLEGRKVMGAQTVAGSLGPASQGAGVSTEVGNASPTPNGADISGKPSRPLGEGVIYGTVFGTDDQPMADTAVHLYLHNGSVAYPPQASDSMGRFRFESVPVGDAFYTLWAVSPDGHAAATLWEVMMEDHPISQRFLELEPTQPITGTVVDPDDNPIAGARVLPLARQRSEGGAPERTIATEPVFTDGSGRFEVPYLAEGQWHCWARAEGFAPVWFGPVATGADAGSVTLPHGNTITGTLVSQSTGETVSGVEVILVDGGDPMQPPKLSQRETTGPEGRFQFADLPAFPVRLFTEEGWIAEPVKVALGLGGAVPPIQLFALPGAAVRGQVVTGDGGEGVGGLKVTLRERLRAPKTALTDDGGRYSFSGLPAGNYAVSVTANVEPHQRAVALELGDMEEGLDFKTQRGNIQVSGEVANSSGTPMAGVRVEAFDQSGVMAPRTQVTDAIGVFTFAGLPPVEFLWIRGSRDGWKSRDLNPTDLREDLSGLVLTMEPIAGLSGRLVDAQGKPVSEIALSARATDHHQYSSRGSRTTARGRFAFPNLVSGTYTVYAQEGNGPSIRLGDVVQAEGETKSDVLLTYTSEPGLAVRGRVVDGAGKLVPAALVYLRTAGGGGQTSDTSDREGRFEFTGLPKGLYQVIVQATGFSKTTVSDVLPEIENLEVVVLPLARIEGRILSADGRHPDTFFVHWLDGERDQISTSEKESAVGVNDPTGQFELSDVNAGTVTIAAWAEGYAPSFATLELGGGEERSGVELRLEPEEPDAPAAPEKPEATTSLHGLVVNARKEPVAGAYLYLEHRPHPTDRSGDARATSGPAGRFVIEAVSLGTNRVLAWHPDYVPAGTVLALAGKPVHEVTVVMTPGGTLEGALTGGGEPLRDAHLSVDSLVLDERFYDNIYPDGKGHYRAGHVAAGGTTVNVHYKGRWYKFPAVVPEGAVATVDIDLQTGTAAIDGTLIENGQPVQGQITVTMPLPGGGEEGFTQQTTTNGRFYLDGLPAGTLALEGRGDSGERVTREVESIAQETVAVEIDLE